MRTRIKKFDAVWEDTLAVASDIHRCRHADTCDFPPLGTLHHRRNAERHDSVRRAHSKSEVRQPLPLGLACNLRPAHNMEKGTLNYGDLTDRSRALALELCTPSSV